MNGVVAHGFTCGAVCGWAGSIRRCGICPETFRFEIHHLLAHRRGRDGTCRVSGDRTRPFLDWRVQGGGTETEDFKTQDAREEVQE
jgi:hypothetical protein